MAERFLVGLDESDCSSRALEFAAARAKEAGTGLVVAYVIEWSPFAFQTQEENEVRRQRREQEISTARSAVLEPALATLKERGVEAEGIVRHGNVAKVLDDLAVEHEVSQLVIGRIGDTGLGSMIFGSVSAKLVQMASVPITVVP